MELKVGREIKPLGSGIRRGWSYGFSEDADFAGDVQFKKPKWRPSKYTCPDCGEPLEEADIDRYFFFTVWKCPNGHRFEYYNTC